MTINNMSEGESKQAQDNVQEVKSESMATPTGQVVSSVSPPVSMVTQSPATAATEDEEEESEDESEILEESPCGRWQKRREEVLDMSVGEPVCCYYKTNNHTNFVLPFKVNQRNVPGIDNAYLAMDTEEGVEVVWNEVMFSERKNFKLQEVGALLDQRSTICGAVAHCVIAWNNPCESDISRWAVCLPAKENSLARL